MSYQFKVGDKVRAIRISKSFGMTFEEFLKMNGGDKGVITMVYYNGDFLINNTFIFDARDLELITNNNKEMNIREKFITAFLSEPEKSFRKAGITNGDGILTTEGQEIFLAFLLKKYGPEFKTEVVDELLKEEKE